MKVRLAEVAHSRAGDKGTLVTLSLIPYDPRHYPDLCRLVTAEVVRDHLAGRVHGHVLRHEMPNLPALLFVCRRDPDDTVTASLYLDTHAKSLSSALLELIVDLPDTPEGRSA
ncbi:AtuA-related protein [Actinoallomurus sp. CA-150999]|uniref:AtuA-related protein n=1 Tax=Actinoallomurus sp. CA-150999 TaxID=3239887 RepID=UPI003D90E07E